MFAASLEDEFKRKGEELRPLTISKREEESKTSEVKNAESNMLCTTPAVLAAVSSSEDYVGNDSKSWFANPNHTANLSWLALGYIEADF